MLISSILNFCIFAETVREQWAIAEKDYFQTLVQDGELFKLQVLAMCFYFGGIFQFVKEPSEKRRTGKLNLHYKSSFKVR